VLGVSGLAANAAIGLLSVLFVVGGAETVVKRIERVARYYGISDVVIAMTVLSIGTSLPELALHVVGSYNILLNPGNVQVYQRISATVLGSNIGSDVVQQTLVLGLVVVAASLMRDNFGFRFSKKFLVRDYLPMIGTTLMTLLLAWDGVLSQLDGGILFGSFLAYMYFLYTTRKETLIRRTGDAEKSKKPRIDLFVAISGMIVVVYFADVFLQVSEILIAETGLSGSMIGVATVGVVSAMPEMVTAIAGLRQGAEGISLGTLIGSNITNPLFAIGMGSLISTYAVPRPLVLWDLPMETITAAVLLTYLLNRRRIALTVAPVFGAIGFEGLQRRMENTQNRVLTILGALLLAGMYVVYLWVRLEYFGVDFT
ncbi:MAG: sodium:calcium antiporter, partial [Candidatus Aenigmatarchaeota archaeon]